MQQGVSRSVPASCCSTSPLYLSLRIAWRGIGAATGVTLFVWLVTNSRDRASNLNGIHQAGVNGRL